MKSQITINSDYQKKPFTLHYVVSEPYDELHFLFFSIKFLKPERGAQKTCRKGTVKSPG